VGGKRGGGGKRAEMTQMLYAHVNKRNKKKKYLGRASKAVATEFRTGI
jgi:hypothetical protein